MTKTVSLEEIPYSPDTCELFDRIRDLPGAALFDSAYPHSNTGRYDILTACPLDATLPVFDANANEQQARSFFNDLRNFHHEHYREIHTATQDIPFCGGILGYIEYEAGYALNKLSPPVTRTDRSPAHLQAYEWAVVQDHLLKRSVLAALPSVSNKRKRDLSMRLRVTSPSPQPLFNLTTPFVSNFSCEQYEQAFDIIKGYIFAGDCYQVNLAQCFSTTYNGDPWTAYRALRAIAAAPFSAYITTGQNDAVLSLSPERFIALHGHHVETSPIKGTRPRHSDVKADEAAANELRSSQKDRAENLMIVDLLRNDLGRSCVPGSIHVDKLFELQSFPTVHHLVSTISGELKSERSAWELLRDSFPGGSITGAPKRRAMEIIAEVEPHSRQAYCGSMLYVSADGRMDSNIAIRTLVCRDKNISCWGGGGIVADSQQQQEYVETYDKVGKFLHTLEQTIPNAANVQTTTAPEGKSSTAERESPAA